MESDRLRARRLPEDVVLQDPNAAVSGQLGGDSPRALRENLRGNHGVRFPRVAQLPRTVLGVATGNPVHLVGADSRFILSVEEQEVALAEKLEATLGDEPFLDDQEAVLSEALDMLRAELVDQERGLVLSGS
jgi:hypothetical protein